MKYPVSKAWIYVGVLVLLVLIALPIFSHLDAMSLKLWDEARLAGNSLEMYQNHNWIVTMFDGVPDMWNTKPPLEIWLQVISMHVFGINELGVRIPSAIAGMLTCLLLIWFFNKRGHFWLGIISSFILVTTTYTTIHHGVRSGDYDSVLTLFTTAYCISYFLFLESGKRKYFNFVIVFVILAALTKGVAGIMLLPGLFIYTLYARKTVQIFKMPNLYIGIGAFVVFVIGYYLLREHYNHGYLSAVWQNELGGRYNTTIEKHEEGFWFYYDMLHPSFDNLFICILPGIAAGLFFKDKLLRRETLYIFVLAICHWFIISCAETKIVWYEMPLLPFVSVLIGIFIYCIFRVLTESELLRSFFTKPVLAFAFLFIVLYPPYKAKMDKILSPDNGEFVSDMASYLQSALHGNRNLDGSYVSWQFYHAEQSWYTNVFKLRKKPITFLENIPDDMKDKTIAVSDDGLKDYIEKNFVNKKLENIKSVVVYKIESNKMDSASVRKAMMQQPQ